jgi:COP9 signalosome complex subunit 7
MVQTLTYSELTAQLGISSVRELEDLIITECFYKGIITGKLDQQRRCLQVQYTSPH